VHLMNRIGDSAPHNTSSSGHPIAPRQQLPTYFHIGSETHPTTTKADDDSFGTSGKPKGAAQLFGTSHEKMKPDPPSLPATKSVITPGSESGSEREAIRLLGERKRGQSFPLPLPGGGAGQVPCAAVPELIFWCWDTAKGPHAHASFKLAARRLGVPAAAEWSADREYIGLNPEDRRGKVSPHKREIASHLLDKLRQA
jgi:hypothetical protein